MKKIMLSAAFAATLSISALGAGKTGKYDDVKSVSYSVLSQFYSDFRNAENVTWTITPTTQKAEFEVEGVKQVAFYDLNGNYLGLTQKVSYKKLPAVVQKQLTKDYADYSISDVIKFQVGEPLPAYGIYSTGRAESTVYFVDVKKEGSEMILKSSESGDLAFFKQIK